MKRGAASLLAIALLALAAAGGLSARAGPPAGRGLAGALLAFLLGAAVVGVVALVVTAVVALWPEGPLRPPEPSLVELGLRTLVFCLVLLAVLYLGAAVLQAGGFSAVFPQGISDADAAAASAGAQRGPFPWRLMAVGALAAVGAFAALALRTRGARSTPLPSGVAAPLAELLDRLVEDLRLGGDPRSQVIAAYAEMVDLFTAQGYPAAASEAPGEYLQRVLPVLGLGGRPAQRLLSLYELARFSQLSIEDDLQRRAAAALAAVREELIRA